MDGLDKSMPFSEGMVDAENNTKPREPLSETCLNCGAKLIDTYCHHCGQRNIPRRQTIGELLTNFVSSFWSYEGKFFLTTKYLVTRPGFLATEYTEGKRERYYHPARMYVFISFVFFLLAFSLPDSDTDDEVELTEEDRKELAEELKEDDMVTNPYYNDSLWKKPLAEELAKDSSSSKKKKKNSAFKLGSAGYKSLAAYDSAQNALPEDERDNWFVRKLQIRAIELNEKYKEDGDFGKDFYQVFKDNFSKVLFYLLPFFALLLRLLYVRRDFFYSEHLVFSIYYYNFFYLGAFIYLLVDLIPVVNDFTFIIGFWIYFHLLFAMKRMYLQSWKKTILKFVLFSFGFSFLMTIALSIAALIILMVM